MSDFSKLGITSLPSKEKFHSQLTNSSISDEDYQRAQKVWDAFGCKTMREYHDLHLKTDVLLLANVMTELSFVLLFRSRINLGCDAEKTRGEAGANH